MNPGQEMLHFTPAGWGRWPFGARTLLTQYCEAHSVATEHGCPLGLSWAAHAPLMPCAISQW